MKQSSLTIQSLPQVSLLKKMLFGACMGLLLAIAFLIMVRGGRPGLEPLWFIRPLLAIPFAGGCAGVFYFLMEPMRRQGGWKMGVAYALCVLVYFVGLWLGFVAGFAGTYWH